MARINSQGVAQDGRARKALYDKLVCRVIAHRLLPDASPAVCMRALPHPLAGFQELRVREPGTLGNEIIYAHVSPYAVHASPGTQHNAGKAS